MYKLVAFDLDGTLLDTLIDLKEAVNQVYRELGMRDLTYKEMRDAVGYGNRKLFEDTYRLLTNESANDTQLDEMVAKWSKNYEKCYLDQTVEYKGITKLLKHLASKGIKLAVISNKKDEFTKKLIAKCFKELEFVDVIGDSDKYPRKPDPTSLLAVASIANVDIKDTLYVGDSENDFKVARNAGCDSLLVTWGFRDKDVLKAYNPDYLCDSVEEIINLF